MRLIDADALEEGKFHSIENWTPIESASWQQGWNDAIDAIINNAPTVDAESLNAKHEEIGYEKGYRDGYAEALEVTDDAVEVVAKNETTTEVVRCKDCVYCKRFNDVWYLPKRDELLCTLYVETYHTTENDFCSLGERREDE